MVTVITFGTFDMMHPGHINLLQRAATLGDRLVVGVSSDNLNTVKEKQPSFYNEKTRLDMVAALACVTEVFLEESLEKKADYTRDHHADVLVMGSDWDKAFDWVGEETGCRVIYLPRTEGISTTDIKNGCISPDFKVAE